MRLESLYKPHLNEVFEISIKKPFYLDWEEVIRRTLELRDSPEVVATAFIKGVAKAILRVAQLVELEKVALSGEFL